MYVRVLHCLKSDYQDFSVFFHSAVVPLNVCVVCIDANQLFPNTISIVFYRSILFTCDENEFSKLAAIKDDCFFKFLDSLSPLSAFVHEIYFVSTVWNSSQPPFPLKAVAFYGQPLMLDECETENSLSNDDDISVPYIPTSVPTCMTQNINWTSEIRTNIHPVKNANDFRAQRVNKKKSQQRKLYSTRVSKHSTVHQMY